MRILYLSMLVILLLFQTGCWNAREIDELGFVMGIALDATETGDVKVTVQMAKPETQSKSPTGGGDLGKEKPYWIARGTGKTFFEAIRNMATFSSRRVFWSHNKVIIINEKLARTNIYEMLDFFSRNPELRLRTWIAVTPGNAGEILTQGPNMEKDPASSIERVIDLHNFTGKGYVVMLKDFLESYLSPGGYPVASRITVNRGQTEPTPQLSGAAVFNKDKLAGWLDEQETRGLLWLQKKITGAVIVVPCPFDEKPMSIEITGVKVDYQSTFDGQQPALKVNINATGRLSEQACRTNFSIPSNLNEMGNALASVIAADTEAAIRAAQEDLGLDFPGFSHVFHRQHNKEWQRLSKQWPTLFKEMEVSVQVKAQIPRVSLFAKPLNYVK